MKNVGESVLARLRNQARAQGVDMQLLLNRYVLERFLYRLSISPHADRYCLKGGLLVAVWNEGDLFRPTNDIDLNGYDSNSSIEHLEQVVRDVAAVEVPDDGVRFDTATLNVKKAREGFVAGGKVELDAYVHTSRTRVRADVGFGNAITPKADFGEFPSLLDVPRPRVQMYPPETVIAEKLHAMARHGMENTRLKDYFDIWLLRQKVAVSPAVLADAISRTFECHRTDVPQIAEFEGLSDEYVESKSRAWDRYVKEAGLSVAPPSLAEVVSSVRELVVPALEAARTLAPVPAL